MTEEGIKSLLGTIEEPENSEYDELNIDLDELAFERYDFIELLNSINTPEFKSIYLNFSNNKYPSHTRRDMAIEILEKINEEYNIMFDLSMDATSDDVDNVFKFLEFIEYDHVDFISDVWKFMDVNLRSDIREFCMRNSDNIIKVIEDQIETHYLSPLISLFLRTYNKMDMIGLFVEMTNKSIINVLLKIEEGKVNNE